MTRAPPQRTTDQILSIPGSCSKLRLVEVTTPGRRPKLRGALCFLFVVATLLMNHPAALGRIVARSFNAVVVGGATGQVLGASARDYIAWHVPDDRCARRAWTTGQRRFGSLLDGLKISLSRHFSLPWLFKGFSQLVRRTRCLNLNWENPCQEQQQRECRHSKAYSKTVRQESNPALSRGPGSTRTPIIRDVLRDKIPV